MNTKKWNKQRWNEEENFQRIVLSNMYQKAVPFCVNTNDFQFYEKQPKNLFELERFDSKNLCCKGQSHEHTNITDALR
jgi:hypothetical protein